MKDTPKAPAKETPEPSAFEDLTPWERMKEFTRRLVAVPKTELPPKQRENRPHEQ